MYYCLLKFVGEGEVGLGKHLEICTRYCKVGDRWAWKNSCLELAARRVGEKRHN
jgi:hypothetical protein